MHLQNKNKDLYNENLFNQPSNYLIEDQEYLLNKSK